MILFLDSIFCEKFLTQRFKDSRGQREQKRGSFDPLSL
jgi:hypothetical protein